MPRTPPPDLPSMLLDGRIVYIGMSLQWLDPKEPVYIYINSTGTTRDDGETVGMESEGFAIYDSLMQLKNEVHTVCMGAAIGHACLLLSVGTKGKRFMMPHSKAMIQQPRVPSSGLMPASDVLIRAEEMFFTLAYVSPTAATATPPPYANSSSSSPATSLPHSASSDFSIDNFVVDNKNALRYDAMIFEAISELADPNGSDVGSIFSFIEVETSFSLRFFFALIRILLILLLSWLLQPFLTELVVYLWKEQPSHEVPPTFRRVLSSRLRRLAAQGKLPKVSNSKPLLNFYKLPDGSETTNRTTPAPTPKPKETNTKPRHSYINQPPLVSQEMIDEAAITGACKVVEAENKINIAKAAVEE
ncbi:hypothetical protein HID58_029012 [Brassica napus]|uniref:ATP-dependent Clp protease proteolytic subunit n=1 Tax=Brassica napus TaxID=3708 RepID=A0ABQ8CBX3_BRANA|nr:hypothetical protein HID58_029012 [Brassica napus]